MAQTEDTELRDIVIETLERNGSLAKIRALLRANIFLAFEDDCANLKQNVNLDSILKLPEGVLALSIVHEFLEFCNLKNTLFVYMSESRQGNDYNYDGKKSISEKLHISKSDNSKEPLLITLLKNAHKSPQKKYHEQNDDDNFKKYEKCTDGNYRDEENCTYIVHEDSPGSTTSNSHSDNSSSDEKNKLHLRLHLDNSDTDTSSDCARDKTSSEYIPGDHVIDLDNKNGNKMKLTQPQNSGDFVDVKNMGRSISHQTQENIKSALMTELKLSTNSSSDSTSYIDLKPLNSFDEKMINTAGLPIAKSNQVHKANVNSVHNRIQSKIDSEKSGDVCTVSPVSVVNDSDKTDSGNKKTQESGKSEGDTADYSFDFTPSPVSKHQDRANKHIKSTESIQGTTEKYSNKHSPVKSPHQVSRSSQSSVSLSDVADLISEKSFISYHTNDKSNGNKSNSSGSIHSKEKRDNILNKVASDDSGDFTESPVPSLSNLSLDIHSE